MGFVKNASVMRKENRFLGDMGVLLLRLFVGIRLIYGVIDNVTSWEDMLRFRDFLQASQFPFPLVCAMVSVYAQLICGILVITGVLFRWASAIMVFNFMVALFMVHWGQSFEEKTTPLLLVFIFLFFTLHGPGSLTVQKITGKPAGTTRA